MGILESADMSMDGVIADTMERVRYRYIALFLTVLQERNAFFGEIIQRQYENNGLRVICT